MHVNLTLPWESDSTDGNRKKGILNNYVFQKQFQRPECKGLHTPSQSWVYRETLNSGYFAYIICHKDTISEKVFSNISMMDSLWPTVLFISTALSRHLL